VRGCPHEGIAKPVELAAIDPVERNPPPLCELYRFLDVRLALLFPALAGVDCEPIEINCAEPCG
jgi:hypothetical protein